MRNSFKIFLWSFLFLFTVQVHGQQRVSLSVTMWTTGSHTLWDGNTVQFYGFSPGFNAPVFPGPTLYVNEGDTVDFNVRNQSQGAPHTVHLHGLDVDQATDGVPQTSFSIYHSEDTTYTFIATHAGTYLYHCHVASVVHVQLGMYGTLVVRAAGGTSNAWTGGPAFDREYNWLISEIDKAWFDNIPVHNTGDSVDETFLIPPYEPDYFLVNGFSQQDLVHPSVHIQGNPGNAIYLRLSNIGYLENRIHFPASLNASIIASDGRPLPSAINSDTIWVRPGERYGVMLTPTQEITDSIAVTYLDMNNQQIAGEEMVPVWIDSSFVSATGALQTQMELDIYPNPGSEFVFLGWKGQNRKGGRVKVFDQYGKMVLEKRIPAATKNLKVDVPDLSTGIYYFQVYCDGNMGVKRWIKR